MTSKRRENTSTALVTSVEEVKVGRQRSVGIVLLEVVFGELSANMCHVMTLEIDTVIQWLKKQLLRLIFVSRRERSLREYGCVCYCPGCGDILNDQAYCQTDGVTEMMTCRECGTCSEWYFDTPVPILANKK